MVFSSLSCDLAPCYAGARGLTNRAASARPIHAYYRLARCIPHRGLLYWSFALLAIVFVRLTFNPEVFGYEPRGHRVFNWYLYTYVTCAVAMFVAAWWFARACGCYRRCSEAGTNATAAPGPRTSPAS